VPKGIDSAMDPRRSVERDSIVRRIVSRFTDSGPAPLAPAAATTVGGRTPPPRPTGNRTQPPRSLAAEYATRPNLYGTVGERLAHSPARVEPRVEHARETNARVSDQVSRGGHLGADPQDRSLGSWRSSDRGYRKP
jgi:hypothetical protein